MSELEDMYKSMPKEEKSTKLDDRAKEKQSIIKKSAKPPTPIMPQKTKEEEDYEQLQKEGL